MQQAMRQRHIRLMLPVECQQGIEHGRHIGQTHLNVPSYTMRQVRAVTDVGDHTPHGFDQHALIPAVFRTELESGRLLNLTGKAAITE